jgi:endonuclease/exonuclease/phosphatase family metal-dependent hydrolase
MPDVRRSLIVALMLLAVAPATAAAATREVRVMTYNIASAVETSNDLGPIAEAIELRDPDVVGLQEVDRSWSRSDSIDQARDLALLLGMSFRFDPNLDCSAFDFDNDGVCRYGTAVLSRLRLRASAGREHRLPHVGEDEPRGLAQVGITVRGRRLTVFNTHLSAHQASRLQQVRAILRVLSVTSPPYVLLGDFNAESRSPEIRLLRARLVDVAAAARLKRPTAGNKRIDYIFVSRGIRVRSAYIPPAGERRVSDHRPLVARVQF